MENVNYLVTYILQQIGAVFSQLAVTPDLSGISNNWFQCYQYCSHNINLVPVID